MEKKEIYAGITNFLACAYIVVLNPAILSQTGMPVAGLVTSTIILTFFSTFLMGVLGKSPIVVAPGMGLNTYFVFTLVLNYQVPWQTALGMVFWAGVIFIILSILNVRTKIAVQIPNAIRCGVSSGIGLFLILIGLTQSHLVVDHPVTLLTVGKFKTESIVFVFGLITSLFFLVKKVNAGFLISIVTSSILFHLIKGNPIPSQIVSSPDFSLFFKLDISNAFAIKFLPAIFALVFTDLFDGISTFIAVSSSGNLLDDRGNPKNLERGLLVDALSTLSSSLMGTSPGTSYIESVTGIKAGGRTGHTAIISSLLFLPFLFLSPLIQAIPREATAPVLIIVGLLMLSQIKQINTDAIEEIIPAGFALTIIPFTFSISHGIIWSILTFLVLSIFQGKTKQISPALWTIGMLCLLILGIPHI